MRPIPAAGVLIGVLCGIWTFVMGFTGWYKDPRMVNVFFVVILIEIGVLIWGLRRTAAEGRRYGGQVLAGLAMSAIGGLILIAVSLLFTAVVFPDYFQEIRAMQETAYREAGMPDAQVRTVMDRASFMYTPVGNALSGFVMTLLTGGLASLVIAAFVRARS